MWAEPLPNGKVKFVERYEDPMTGKVKKVSCTLDKDTRTTRKTATDILADKIRKRLSAAPVANSNLKLRDLIDKYRTDQAATKRESTYKRNYFACESLMRILGADTLVSRLNAGYVRKCFNDTGDDNGTLNERLTRFKALLRWGYENDYIDDIRWIDKLKKYPDPGKKERLQDKFLEREELKQLLSKMAVDRWRLLTSFMALSGLRAGEAIALELKDVDAKSRIIHVTKTRDPVNDITTDPKTLSSKREIFIQDELLDLCHKIRSYTLSENLRNGCKSTLFFCDLNGDYVDYYAYNKYLRETSIRVLGRPITTHVLRHTHVALMAEAGVDLDVISRRLGHESSKITKEVYYHVTKTAQKAENEHLKSIKLI